MIVIAVVVIILGFVFAANHSKRNDMYQQAKAKLESGKYLESIEDLESLHGFKDSKDLEIEAIKAQIIDYSSGYDYDKAISLINQYASLTDFSSELNDIKKQKEATGDAEEIYQSAIDLLKDGSIVKGIEELNKLPNGFVEKDDIIESYEFWSGNLFIGKTRVSAKEKGTENVIYLNFNLGFDEIEERVCLVARRKKFDGYTQFGEETFFINRNSLITDIIKQDGYTWILYPTGARVDAFVDASINEVTPSGAEYDYAYEITSR